MSLKEDLVEQCLLYDKDLGAVMAITMFLRSDQGLAILEAVFRRGYDFGANPYEGENMDSTWEETKKEILNG